MYNEETLDKLAKFAGVVREASEGLVELTASVARFTSTAATYLDEYAERLEEVVAQQRGGDKTSPVEEEYLQQWIERMKRTRGVDGEQY